MNRARTSNPSSWESRRAASAAKDLKVLKDRIPAECPLDVRALRTPGGTWRFSTTTGKGPMRFEVAAAYVDGYLAGWLGVTHP